MGCRRDSVRILMEQTQGNAFAYAKTMRTEFQRIEIALCTKRLYPNAMEKCVTFEDQERNFFERFSAKSNPFPTAHQLDSNKRITATIRPQVDRIARQQPDLGRATEAGHQKTLSFCSPGLFRQGCVQQAMARIETAQLIKLMRRSKIILAKSAERRRNAKPTLLH